MSDRMLNLCRSVASKTRTKSKSPPSRKVSFKKKVEEVDDGWAMFDVFNKWEDLETP